MSTELASGVAPLANGENGGRGGTAAAEGVLAHVNLLIPREWWRCTPNLVVRKLESRAGVCWPTSNTRK
jgi:hypothetical protein